MTRVLVLQHQLQDHPAYLGRWLREAGRAIDLRNTEAGDPFPDSIDGYEALAVLGGEMSANDPLPSLRQAERLIRDAMSRDVPVIGHCLGGQLMARALGAAVPASPQPEVGWHDIDLTSAPEARAWFGEVTPVTVFQWHGEAFDVPPGAVPLAGNEACPHQAFAIGRHLAMQFHVELDADKLQAWAQCREPSYLAAVQRHITVQSSTEMMQAATQRLAAQQALADRLYRRWLGLA